MHLSLSCTAAFELLQRNTKNYIQTTDEARVKGWIELQETTMLLSLIRMIQAFRSYQRTVAELSQLSDRELADIGLDRSDIPRIAGGHGRG